MIRHMPTLHREYYRTLWLLLLLWIYRKKWRFLVGARNWLPLWNKGQKSDGRLQIWCSILPLWNKGQKSDGRLQIWCSIQVSLHKEPPEVGLVKKLTGSLYWWVEQCVPTLHRECYRTLWLWINRKKRRFFTGATNCLPLWIKGQKSDGRL